MKIAIGRFGRAHGVRGEIRFWPFNRDSEMLAAPRPIEVGTSPERLKTWQLERIRFDAKGAIVRFAEVNDRDVVGVLTNQSWYEDRDAFPPLSDDEVYFADLIGLQVVTSAGVLVGSIKDVLDTGPTEMLVIDRVGREAMLPNVPEFVLEMDLDAGKVVVEPPVGLIDGLDD